MGICGALYFIGSGLAGVIWSIVSDKIGRKKTLIITMLLSVFSIISAGLSWNFDFFMVMIFFIGFGLSGYEVTT